MAGRSKQLAYKKMVVEQQLRMKEAENELWRITYETNKKELEEDAKLRADAAAAYRDDLCKQIDYNNILRVSIL